PGPVASSQPGHRTWWLLGLIIALGVVVRFPTLNEQSFWYDEAATWRIVAHGLGHVFATVPKTESTPPLYYVLLWLWSRVFGIGEVGLRSFSAVASTLTIPVMWLIGRRLVCDRAGLIAALLTAVSPLLFWYAQEARSYSLLLLFSAIALLAFVRALQAPTRGRVLAWSLACALALATHYYAAVMIAAEGVYLALVLWRRRLLTVDRIVLGAGPVVAVGAGLTPLLISQNNGRASFIATQEGSLPYRIVELAKEDLIGQGQPEKALLTAIGVVFVLVALWLLMRRAGPRSRRAALTMAAVGACGVAIAIVVSVAATDYFDTRNLMATWPALILVVAIGLAAARARRVGTLVTAGLVVLSLVCVWNIISMPRFQRPDWRGAAQAMGPSSSTRAIVTDIQSQVPLTPYLRRLAVDPAAGEAVREVDLIWLWRASQWGPLGPITPRPLAGFAPPQVIRTSSYVVLRYRAATPRPESPATLNALYPLPARALTLVQPAAP
ncbi:MAG TPA: glycosyltransferase family 39 protein, partial [Solirubrobacteraceae bacterium]|nr:glycosyltransferase family 39 protein [Solirubrobacteraceae bacterium]